MQYVAQWKVKIVDVVSLMLLTTSPPSHFVVLRSIPPAPISSSRSNGCADDPQYAQQWRRIHRRAIEAAIDLIVMFAMSHAARWYLHALCLAASARDAHCVNHHEFQSPLSTMRVRRRLTNVTTIVVNDACLACSHRPRECDPRNRSSANATTTSMTTRDPPPPSSGGSAPRRTQGGMKGVHNDAPEDARRDDVAFIEHRARRRWRRRSTNDPVASDVVCLGPQNPSANPSAATAIDIVVDVYIVVPRCGICDSVIMSLSLFDNVDVDDNAGWRRTLASRRRMQRCGQYPPPCHCCCCCRRCRRNHVRTTATTTAAKEEEEEEEEEEE